MARPKKNAQSVKETQKVQETPAQEAEAVEEVKTPNVETVTDEKTAPPTFTEEQVQAMIAEAVSKATKEAVEQTTATFKAQNTPQVIQVSADTERVHFLWQAEVSDENVYEIGPQGMYGRIVGKTGSFMVPKGDLSRVMDSMFRLLLERRWIIAVDGLTDEEREAYGVNYKEGELLDKRCFAKMVELGNGILDIYPKLCKGHREMVAKRYHEAYLNNSQYVTREIVVELNRLSKQMGSPNGDFTDIIEAMNRTDLN